MRRGRYLRGARPRAPRQPQFRPPLRPVQPPPDRGLARRSAAPRRGRSPCFHDSGTGTPKAARGSLAESPGPGQPPPSPLRPARGTAFRRCPPLEGQVAAAKGEGDFRRRTHSQPACRFEVAFRTPDVASILGPPGTGKTRVIQALLAMLAGAPTGRRPRNGVSHQLPARGSGQRHSRRQRGCLPVDRQGGRRDEEAGALSSSATGPRKPPMRSNNSCSRAIRPRPSCATDSRSCSPTRADARRPGGDGGI